MGVKDKGLDKLINDFDVLSKNSPSKSREFMQRLGELVKGEVKLRTPVDTGELRNSWHYKSDIDGSSVIIYNNKEYASDVEFGHETRNGGFVSGQYMLHDSLDVVEGNIEDLLRAYLDEVIGS